MNTIRTPKQGRSATSRRIAEAVDNEGWQLFRVSLKGLSTKTKLWKLEEYWNQNGHYPDGHVTFRQSGESNCDVCVRVDNYIKALCRGGQLYAGESLATALHKKWNLKIKK